MDNVVEFSGNSRVYAWAYNYKVILDNEGVEWAEHYAFRNIPRQFNKQIRLILKDMEDENG